VWCVFSDSEDAEAQHLKLVGRMLGEPNMNNLLGCAEFVKFIAVVT
jgi:hypothetical protein